MSRGFRIAIGIILGLFALFMMIGFLGVWPIQAVYLLIIGWMHYLATSLPKVTVDPAKFPIFSAGLLADMRTEAQKFLDNALWNGNLTDLLLSRTTFLSTGLASNIYLVPVPAGATSRARRFSFPQNR